MKVGNTDAVRIRSDRRYIFMEREQLNKIVYSALMAAITCIATMVIRVPSVGGTGYVNIGDTAVLLCAWLIGGIYGAFAAGIGSGLADLLAGYAYYVPGTFVIKFAMALVAYLIYNNLKRIGIARPALLVISSIPAELVMIAGYFLYKALILGKGFTAALPSVFTNMIQGVTCIITAILVELALEGTRLIKRNIGTGRNDRNV